MPATVTRPRAWRSLVSALVWGTRGPEFESRRPDTESPANRAFVCSWGEVGRAEKTGWTTNWATNG